MESIFVADETKNIRNFFPYIYGKIFDPIFLLFDSLTVLLLLIGGGKSPLAGGGGFWQGAGAKIFGRGYFS